MSADDHERGPFSLRRWSQRKLASARTASPAVARESSVPALEPPLPPATSRVAPVPPSDDSLAAPATTAAPQAKALPPVESLTLDSDFTPFLQPQVAEGVRRQALRQLFRDPHFNAMDGLDVYIDDYSRPDPLPAALARQLVQARYVLDPPATRVNAEGVVEDVPRETIATSAAEATEATEATEASTAAGARTITAKYSEQTTSANAVQSITDASTPVSMAAKEPASDAAPADPRPDSAATR